MSTPSSPASPLEALKAGFRRACVRRLVGDEGGAVKVLRDEIPTLVVSWAKSNSLDPAEKKLKLKEMFDDESARADELAVAFDLFSGRFEARVADLVKKEVGELVSHIQAISNELGSAVNLIGELADKLNAKAKPNDDRLNEGSITRTPKIDAQTRLPIDLLGDEKKSVKPKLSSTVNSIKGSVVDIEKSEELLEMPRIEGKKNDDPDLDPPAGTGLRFDEIEEMIDEILSYETK